MTLTKEAAKKHIKDHIQNRGGAYSSWYVGIASDVKQRLFTDHNVDEKNGQWAWAECENADAARDVEDYFVNTLGTKGGPGGGDSTTKFVYAYKITSSTKE
jgi:hypothetical protein